jgi:hypothetical protein
MISDDAVSEIAAFGAPRHPIPIVRKSACALLRRLARTWGKVGYRGGRSRHSQAFKTIKTELLDPTIEAHNDELLSQRATGCSSSSGM